MSEELPKKLLDRVWKDKHGRLIMAKFVSLVGDNLTISMKGKPFEVKLSSLSPESQALARKLAQAEAGGTIQKLSPEEVAAILGAYESALAGRAVSMEEILSGEIRDYQTDIDVALGLDGSE